MVICAIVGCGNRSGRDKEKRFYRLPAVISNQGTQTKDLSKKRQNTWLAKIRRTDISPEQYYNIRVCSDHFINGSPGWAVDKVELGKGEVEGERENDERDAEEDTMLQLRFFLINAMSLTGA